MKTIQVKTLFIALFLSTAVPSLPAEDATPIVDKLLSDLREDIWRAKQVQNGLGKAVRKGDVAEAKQALVAGANVNAQDEFGRTVLMWAAVYGHLNVAKLLLENGANINAQSDIENLTALMWAALNDHLDVAELLLENGADITIRDRTGETALEMAELEGKIAVAKLIRAKRQEEVSKAVQEARKELYPHITKLISEFEY